MQYIKAKSIVTKIKPSELWFATDYNMNIYRGCSHGCIYCDSRSECYHIENFDSVRAKENALAIIKEELRRKRKKGVVATGAMSDPYNPFEKKLELTRNALKLINEFGFGAAIATKSPLVARDCDILKEIQSHSPVIVKLTVTAADDSLSAKIEPHAEASSARFKALKELAANEVFAGILMMPLLPFINDTKENIISIVNKAYENGAKFIFPSFGVTLRSNQRDYFYEKLDSLFPDIKKQYIKSFGGEYACNSSKMEYLYSLFSSECRKFGILHKMKDIHKNIQIKIL